MDILIPLIKVFVYAYIPVRAIANKDPAKVFFDRIDFRANHFLCSFKDESVKTVLRHIQKALFKVNVAILLLVIFSALFFPDSSRALIRFLTPIFAAFAVTVFCISWNMNHREVAKKYFLDTPLILLPITPLVGAAAEAYTGQPLVTALPGVRLSMDMMGVGLWPVAALLSIGIFIVYVALPYVMFWLVLAPAFYAFIVLISGMQWFLRGLHRYVATNLMDALVFVGGAVVVFLF